MILIWINFHLHKKNTALHSIFPFSLHNQAWDKISCRMTSQQRTFFCSICTTCCTHSSMDFSPAGITSSGLKGFSYSWSIPVKPETQSSTQHYHLGHTLLVIHHTTLQCLLTVCPKLSRAYTKAMRLTLDFACPGLLVQPLDITGLAHVQRSVHVALKEGQPSLLMELAGTLSVLTHTTQAYLLTACYTQLVKPLSITTKLKMNTQLLLLHF